MSDTNQASEDKLQTAVNRCFIPHDDHSWPCVGCKSTRDNIVNLIRTEKLKLLAEVKERIVSEDVEYIKWHTDITGEQDYYYTVKRPMAVKHQNELRGKQRAELTKLEAEL